MWRRRIVAACAAALPLSPAHAARGSKRERPKEEGMVDISFADKVQGVVHYWKQVARGEKKTDAALNAAEWNGMSDGRLRLFVSQEDEGGIAALAPKRAHCGRSHGLQMSPEQEEVLHRTMAETEGEATQRDPRCSAWCGFAPHCREVPTSVLRPSYQACKVSALAVSSK